MKKNLLLIICSLFVISGAFSQTALEGKVTDVETGEPIIIGTVALYKNDNLISGAETDFDGNYFFSNLDPGTYDIEVSYVGYQTQRLEGVVVNAGQVNRVNMEISSGVLINQIDIVAYKVPLIQIDNTTSGQTVTAEKIRTLPIKNIQNIAANTAGVSQDANGNISMRGSRSDATVYYIDGMRVSGGGNLIPQTEVSQMQVITGGVEAQYGDLVGGAISITSKGPSNKFSGNVELETSEYLDGYGYNLVTAGVSGPILKNKDGQSVIGFRFAGQFRNIEDSAPHPLGAWRAPLDVIEQGEQNPTYFIGETVFPAVELLTNDQVQNFKARPNETLEDLNVTGKLDFKFSDNIDMSISGSFDNVTDQFTPSTAWSLVNWHNNPFSYRDGYRGNIRFRHRLGKQGSVSEEDGGEALSPIRNLYYSIQGSFERRRGRFEDVRYEDRLFEYGYFGRTEREWTVNLDASRDSTNFAGEFIDLGNGSYFGHLGYTEDEGEFERSEEFNSVYNRYQTRNGFIDNTINSGWSGLYSNYGQVYNNFSKSENDIISLQVTSGFDFLPGGSEKGRHSVQFGFLYEQRVQRSYSVSPLGLWTLADISVNNHINGLDPNTVVGTEVIQTNVGLQEVDIYAPAVDADSDLRFFRSVREVTGDAINDYVNIDVLTPDQLRLDMFSASELNDQGLISYIGYDYLGNKLAGGTTFDDFFTSTEDGTPNSARTFVAPANQPIYGAAFIQDKFSFRDIIVRLGLRMDYFDANTKVLKDNYSLYEIETAQEFFNRTGQEQPSSVEDDYRVYVAGEGSESVVGYRRGDQFFRPNGTAVSGGNILFGGTLVNPSLKNPDADIQQYDRDDRNGDGIISNDEVTVFNVDDSFEDYEPQLNLMPRVAFSFPINEEAGFFAHYDVLYQRPTTNTAQTPVAYYYWERSAGNLFNNPDLKPVRTVDYEVGFQQKLTSNSAIKIAAYYKEQSDLIQRRVYAFLPAPVNRYETFDNLDFATTKGFSFSYDRRRAGPIELGLTYTLQFADGSGSDANSSSGINNRGIIRNLIPLSFDERHRITANVDYRYYNGEGPKVFGKSIFQNAGVNFNFIAASGTPYTRRQTVQQFGGNGFKGSINGARLPWNMAVDMRLDKTFQLGLGGGKKVNLNAYLRVQNLFDQRNVQGVFSFTGDPEDDGFLVSQFGTDQIDQITSQGKDVEAFLQAYQWRLDSFRNFTLPRRIFLGLIMDF